jgi:hypothetical protein
MDCIRWNLYIDVLWSIKPWFLYKKTPQVMGTPFPTENLDCAITHYHVDPASPTDVKECPGPHDQGHRKVDPLCRRKDLREGEASKNDERKQKRMPCSSRKKANALRTHPDPPARRDAGGSRKSADPLDNTPPGGPHRKPSPLHLIKPPPTSLPSLSPL